MTTVKLKFRQPAQRNRKGNLYFQIIHRRTVRQIKSEYYIYTDEWDRVECRIALNQRIPSQRMEELKDIIGGIDKEIKQIRLSIHELSCKGTDFSARDIIDTYRKRKQSDSSLLEYIRSNSERLKKSGRARSSEIYNQLYNSLSRFYGGADITFEMINANIIENYEGYMRQRGLCRNTTSFYLRTLRSILNRAVDEGLINGNNSFKRVYTGIDKTSKRALTIDCIRKLKELDLKYDRGLEWARDVFMLSFYLRGMSFIDMAYLRKKDIAGGYLKYIRKKTGHQMIIRWEKPMQDIVDKYPSSRGIYLLPIITQSGVAERRQYQNMQLFVNRKLKKLADITGIVMPLTMYVSRHSWASIAHTKNIPLSVISEGMGHDNEETTRVYLASIQSNKVDIANRSIINSMLRKI